ncbi:hypothetical protein BKA66DRAFT_444263 [Pyrenochaeta sp. MPI-SDFR-AT-0127]|nr:hypothetical protein BKA66DRAFT_444263 [Pyrenochaeta sp. MPI-SDFR-AT-0127]
MDLSAAIEHTTSLTVPNSLYHTTPQPQPHNPYARMSSRRAIACVTCAKAKTKCDKALPSCSRCITKGIKCEPRSTRRTSDNSYRATVKRPFVSTKKYHSSSTVPSLSRQTSPRSIPCSSRHTAMRAASHLGLSAAVKMSQQNSTISGYPMLIPLPTYASQVVDECYSYSSSPDQNLEDFTQAMETNGLSTSGRLTPQTPEAIIYHEPLSMGEGADHYMSSRPWSDDAVASVGIDFDPDMAAMLSTDMWPVPGPESIIPMIHMPWHSPAPSVSPQEISGNNLGSSHPGTIPSLTASECSVDDFNTSGPNQEEWSIYQPTASHISVANLATSAPFMSDSEAIPSHAPIWEDIFLPHSSSY